MFGIIICSAISLLAFIGWMLDNKFKKKDEEEKKKAKDFEKSSEYM